MKLEWQKQGETDLDNLRKSLEKVLNINTGAPKRANYTTVSSYSTAKQN
jgi:hypothetical protein